MNDIQKDKEDDQTEELSFFDKVRYFFNSAKEKVLKIFKRWTFQSDVQIFIFDTILKIAVFSNFQSGW